MKQCSLNDFIEELRPWLDANHIRSAEQHGDGQFIIHFTDGMKNVYRIDDCNEEQIQSVLKKLQHHGIRIKGPA